MTQQDALDWRELMTPLLRMDDGTVITDAVAWEAHREEIRQRTLPCYGTAPDHKPELRIEQLGEVDCGTYTRRTISFLSERDDEVRAYLCVPKNLTHAVPGVLAIHSTCRMGKDQPAGISGDKNRYYGKELAERGYVVLIPDEILAGERMWGDYEPYDTAPFYQRHPEWSAMGKAIWDSKLFVDVLSAQSEVDPESIASIGHSLGGIYTLLTIAFDERVKAGACSCGFRPYFADPEGDDKEGRGKWCRKQWWIGTPHLRPFIEAGELFPYDMHEVTALAAPRGVFIHAARGDNKGYCSDEYYCSAMEGALDEVREVYDLLDAPADRFCVAWSPGAHDFPPQFRQQAYDWLDAVLLNGTLDS